MFKKISKSLAVGVLTVMIMLVSVVPAFANTTPEQAQSALTGEVYNKLSSENYELSGGGSVSGEKLFKEETLQDGSVSYVIVPEQYDALSRSGQQKFAKKLGQVVEASYATEGTEGSLVDRGVTKETALGWLKRMTSFVPGLGTHMMLTLTAGMQPDFISAKSFVRPLEGPIGVIVGVIAYIIFLVLAVIIVSDVAYIGIPAVQTYSSNSNSGGKFTLFSQDAKKSVEESDGSSSKGMLLYLKKRFLFFVALSFVMFYLVMGRMYELVGLVLDLFSGLVGA